MYVLGKSEHFDQQEAIDFLKATLEAGLFENSHTGELTLLSDELRELYSLWIDTGICAANSGAFDIGRSDIFFTGTEFLHASSFAFYSRYAMCDRCEVWHEKGTGIRAEDGNAFCSEECARADGFRQCDRCGDWVSVEWSESTWIGDDFYCSFECVRNAGYEICERCHEWRNSDYGSNVTDYGWVCDHCLDWYDDEFFQCEECEDWHYGDYEYNEYDNRVCPQCSGSSYGLHNYGYTPKLNFFGDTDGNNEPFLGIELETDRGRDRGAYVRALGNLGFNNRVWLTRDSSLDDGVEVTSHPMTFAEHMSCGLWEGVRETALANGFGSHNGGNCGLHIHINRNFFGKSEAVQQVGGFKMMRLMQRFERQFTIFSRRTNNRWCNYKMNRDYSPDKPGKNPIGRTDFDSGYDMLRNDSIIRKADRCVKYETDHSQAVNFQHSKTFEIRIFRGTLLLSTFYASLALARGLARACKCHGEAWIENVGWYELMDWIVADCENETARGYLKNYLDQKGLSHYELDSTTQED